MTKIGFQSIFLVDKFQRFKAVFQRRIRSYSHFNAISFCNFRLTAHTGWAQGKSLLDGFSGWFPKDLTVQLYAGRKSVTFLVDEDEPTILASIALSNRFSVA
jgi:hypothetical protein